jgi:hypothetical protein
MTSTRNNNTRGDYCLQQRLSENVNIYNSFQNCGTGIAYTTHMPDFGIMPNRLPGEVLSSNFVDIESQLHGTHSTSLVDSNFKTNPRLKYIKPTDKFMSKVPFYEMNKVVVDETQRPFPLGN